ncbi:MAG: hypothetical protein JWM95_1481 [Gemmatimonadetes bacterium]|nr:hypothetical protein [Gemmatimonadota bacterium]
MLRYRHFALGTIKALSFAVICALVYQIGDIGRDGLAAAVFQAFIDGLSLYLPLAVFGGGLAVANATSTTSTDETPVKLLLGLAAVSATTGFVVSAFLAPWLAHATSGFLFATRPIASQSLVEWYHEYHALLERARSGGAVLPWMVSVAGMHCALPFIAAGMGALLSVLGFLVGEATRAVPSLSASLYRWSASLALVSAIAVMGSLGMRSATADLLAPGLALSTTLLPPVMLLMTLLWVRAVSRSSVRSSNASLA